MALEDCWAPTPSQGSLGRQPGTGRHSGSQLCCHPGAPWLPGPSGWEAKTRGASLGVFLFPHPSPWGWRSPTVLTQFLGEDLLEGHLTPVLQVLLHDAADAERQRGRVTWGPCDACEQRALLVGVTAPSRKVTPEGPEDASACPLRLCPPKPGWPEGGC